MCVFLRIMTVGNCTYIMMSAMFTTASVYIYASGVVFYKLYASIDWIKLLQCIRILLLSSPFLSSKRPDTAVYLSDECQHGTWVQTIADCGHQTYSHVLTMEWPKFHRMTDRSFAVAMSVLSMLPSSYIWWTRKPLYSVCWRHIRLIEATSLVIFHF